MGQVVEESQFMEQPLMVGISYIVTCICESLHYRMLLCRVICMRMYMVYADIAV